MSSVLSSKPLGKSYLLGGQGQRQQGGEVEEAHLDGSVGGDVTEAAGN